jgi:hypothetical protein
VRAPQSAISVVRNSTENVYVSPLASTARPRQVPLSKDKDGPKEKAVGAVVGEIWKYEPAGKHRPAVWVPIEAMIG